MVTESIDLLRGEGVQLLHPKMYVRNLMEDVEETFGHGPDPVIEYNGDDEGIREYLETFEREVEEAVESLAGH